MARCLPKDRDKGVYQLVGEGIGAKKVVNKKQVASLGASSGSDLNTDNSNSWLDEVIYEDVINKLQLPITNQVNVKLSVVEVTKTFTDNVGIGDWEQRVLLLARSALLNLMLTH